MLVIGIILLVIAGCLFQYWARGTSVERALRPPIFMTSLGSVVVLAITILVAVWGLIFVVLGLT